MELSLDKIILVNDTSQMFVELLSDNQFKKKNNFKIEKILTLRIREDRKITIAGLSQKCCYI